MLRVVLVRPQGPRNVGLAVRLCANFGPTDVVVVSTQAEQLLAHPDFAQMSHGAGKRPRVAATLDEALADVTWIAAFSARRRRHARVKALPSAAPELARRAALPASRVALLFGNERTGLEERECAAANERIAIPTSGRQPSLNLATAVAVALYAVRGATRAAPPPGTRTGRPVTLSERCLLMQRALAALGPRVRGVSARRELEGAIERLFLRAEIESRDARCWHRLFRELLAAEERGRPPDPSS